MCARDRIQGEDTSFSTRFYKLRHTIYKLYRGIYKLHQGFGYLVGTPREKAGGVGDGEWMDER